MKNKFRRILASILAMTITLPSFASAMVKEVTAEPQISLMSLIPIDEANVYIDLNEIPLEQLPQIKMTDLFGYMRDSQTKELIEIDPEATTVWENFYNEEGEYLRDSWKVRKFDDSVNIIDQYLNDDSDLELIIGSGNQLDDGNIRYLVSFKQMPTKSVYMDLSKYLYESLCDFDVSELLRNIPDLKTKDFNSAEILWYVGDKVEEGYKFKHNVVNGWLRAGINETEKFAPTLEEKLTIGSWGYYDTMIIRYDNTSVLCELTTRYPEQNDIFELNFYTQDASGSRKKVDMDSTTTYPTQSSSNGQFEYFYDVNASVNSAYSQDDVYYLGLELNSNFSHYDMKVIKGRGLSEDVILKWVNNSIPQQYDLTGYLVSQDMTQKDTGLKDYWLRSGGLDVTICLTLNNAVCLLPARIGVYRNSDYIDENGIYADVNGDRLEIAYDVSYDFEETFPGIADFENTIVTYYLKKGYKDNDKYNVGLASYDGDTNRIDSSNIVKAVTGHFESLDKANKQPDLKKQLFADNIREVGSGYSADFSGEGVDFTVFTDEDDIWHFTIRTEETNYEDDPEYEDPEYEDPEYNGAPQLGTYDNYFRVNKLYNADNSLATYAVRPTHDTYYSYGYQTFLINDTDVDMTAISPEVILGDDVKVYYGDTQEYTNDDDYYKKLSPRDFTQAPVDVNKDPSSSVRYTVSMQNQEKQKNYHVTAVKKEEGAKLFVNGPDEREILLNDYFSNTHDIFIANVGSEELTGISATLNATNVKLDDYWSVGGEGNDTLAPFTDIYNTTSNNRGSLFNVAKIRLVPDGEGEISGTLTITADGQEPRVINLTGTAGNPKIDTVSIHDAVKYVPYSSIITTNNMHEWNKVTFSLDEGELPDGLTLQPNGEIYGVPKESGQFPITVKASYSLSEFEDSYAEFVLTVKDNSSANVNAMVDEGYELTKKLPSTISKPADMELVSKGEFSEFVALWLDGEKLVENVDYVAKAGSTKITFKSQTLKKLSPGQHTTGLEFYSLYGLKISAQNFYIADASSSGSSNSGGGGGGGGSSSCVVTFTTNGGSAVNKQIIKRGSTIADLPVPVKEGYVFAGWFRNKNLTTPFNATDKINSSITLYAKWDVPVSEPKPTITFSDVANSDWFYDDVYWAYTNNIMVGYDDEQFAPGEPITNTMVVTVLARLSDADMSAYENKHLEDVADGQWYTPYAIWAKEAGIADDISFTSSDPITREMMGLVLMRFLDYLKMESAVNDEFIQFADADLISEKAMNALQTLYKLGIFQGKGDNIIDPLGKTTRAEFAALIHRVHTLINK